jgi:hypothetical protein
MDLSEAPKTGSLPRREADPNAVLGRVTIGFVFVAVCVALTCLLSNGNILALREATFASAADWPEIKNGVPDLKRLGAPTGVSLPATAERSMAASGETPASEISRRDKPADGPSAEVSRPEPTHRGPTSPPSSASVVPTALDPAPLVTMHEPETPRVAAVSAATSAETIRPQPLRAEAPEGTGDTQARDGERSSSSGDASNTGADFTSAVALPPTPTPLPLSSSGAARIERAKSKGIETRAAARRDERQTRKRKPTEPQRTRTAAAPAQDTLASAPTSAAGQPAPQPERIRLLGLPLPTGREIKDCLFALRC